MIVWLTTSRQLCLIVTTCSPVKVAASSTDHRFDTESKLVSKTCVRLKSLTRSLSLVPRILIVQMKRFDYDGRKLTNSVEFPFEFQFEQTYLADELQRKEKNGYIVDWYDDYGSASAPVQRNKMLKQIFDNAAPQARS
jgi:hypothetical protein